MRRNSCPHLAVGGKLVVGDSHTRHRGAARVRDISVIRQIGGVMAFGYIRGLDGGISGRCNRAAGEISNTVEPSDAEKNVSPVNVPGKRGCITVIIIIMVGPA